MRKVVVFTGTRADWGLLSPVAKALQEGGAEVIVAATNAHLSHRHGYTLQEIVDDGFRPLTIPIDTDDDSALGRSRAMAQCLEGAARLIAEMKPDLALILGDRYEMLAAATACLMATLPIVHIAGGAISEGAVDDAIRHSISKMAALHLTETEPYRRRLIAMGEEPERVINTGAIGVENFLKQVHGEASSATDDELRDYVGMDVDKDTLLVTYHPVTLDTEAPVVRVKALAEALECFPDKKILITAPNNDVGGSEIFDFWEKYAAERPGRTALVSSLGHRRYLAVLKRVAAVVGNSSSGIVEVPSAKIPTVDIGRRQCGRLTAASVIHCGDSADEIARAIAFALSDEGRKLAQTSPNPYQGQGSTVQTMVRAILDTPLEALRTKKFHDINP